MRFDSTEGSLEQGADVQRVCVAAITMRSFVLTVLCIAALPTENVQAQSFGRFEQMSVNGVPYFQFVSAGEPSVQVMVMGPGSTGLFEVGTSVTLDQLLVLSSGAVGQASASGMEKTSVQLYRLEGDGRSVIYEASLQQALTDKSELPVLRDGDLLMVEPPPAARESFFKRAAPVLQTVVSLSSLVLQLVLLSSR